MMSADDVAAMLTCGECGGPVAASWPMGDAPAEWLLTCPRCAVTVAHLAAGRVAAR